MTLLYSTDSTSGERPLFFILAGLKTGKKQIKKGENAVGKLAVLSKKAVRDLLWQVL